MGERLLEEFERLLPAPPALESPPLVVAGLLAAVLAGVEERVLVAALEATAVLATVWAVTVTGFAAAAAGCAAGAGVEAGAGMAVTGVVAAAAGLSAAGLPEAEVEVARDLGVAMAVMGSARERSR